MDNHVTNANYERVVAIREKLFKERYHQACTCSRCVHDIAAIALNYLPPHYYVDQEAKNDIGSPWVMVETAVIEAIDRVMEKPNHPQPSHVLMPDPSKKESLDNERRNIV